MASQFDQGIATILGGIGTYAKADAQKKKKKQTERQRAFDNALKIMSTTAALQTSSGREVTPDYVRGEAERMAGYEQPAPQVAQDVAPAPVEVAAPPIAGVAPEQAVLGQPETVLGMPVSSGVPIPADMQTARPDQAVVINPASRDASERPTVYAEGIYEPKKAPRKGGLGGITQFGKTAKQRQIEEKADREWKWKEQESKRKQKNKDNDDFETLSNKIFNASSRRRFGRLQANIDVADAGTTLIQSVGMPPGQFAPANETPAQFMKRLDNMTAQQKAEVVKGLDRLLTQGAPTEHGQMKLEPESFIGNFMNKIVQRLRKSPTGQKEGAFIHNIFDTILRERKFNAIRQKEAIGGMAVGFWHLRDVDPARFAAIVKGENLVYRPGVMQRPQMVTDFLKRKEAKLSPREVKEIIANERAMKKAGLGGYSGPVEAAPPQAAPPQAGPVMTPEDDQAVDFVSNRANESHPAFNGVLQRLLDEGKIQPVQGR